MCTVGFNSNASETDTVEKLCVCNEGLFWLAESCLNYIMLELYSYVSLKTRAKKGGEKKNLFTAIACFPNAAPSTTSASLSLSQTFCPFLTHSSLTHHTSRYSTARGQSEGVRVRCLCQCDWSCCTSGVRKALVRLQLCSSGWKSDESDKLNLGAGALDFIE